jgi:hypothetical protein
LYPIRLLELPEYTALNYEQWNICSDACSLWDELKVPVYQFLKEPIIRKFGADFYEKVEELSNFLQNEK